MESGQQHLLCDACIYGGISCGPATVFWEASAALAFCKQLLSWFTLTKCLQATPSHSPKRARHKHGLQVACLKARQLQSCLTNLR